MSSTWTEVALFTRQLISVEERIYSLAILSMDDVLQPKCLDVEHRLIRIKNSWKLNFIIIVCWIQTQIESISKSSPKTVDELIGQPQIQFEPL